MSSVSSYFTRLKGRSLIQVVGFDATKFLNGLITSKILDPAIESNNQYDCLVNDTSFYVNKKNYLDTSSQKGYKKIGQYTLSLNAKGRLFTDLWIYPFKLLTNTDITNLDFLPKKKLEHSNYLVEVDERVSNELEAFFKLHKLSSKIKLKKFNDVNFNSWYIFSNSNKFQDQLWNFKNQYLKNNELLSTPEIANSRLLEFFDQKKLFNTNDLNYLSNNLFGFTIDERNNYHGLKLLTSNDIQSPLELINEEILIENGHFTKVKNQVLNNQRILDGISEIGDIEPHKFLPLELNYNLMGIKDPYLNRFFEKYETQSKEQEMNEEESDDEYYEFDNASVISFNKGCYIGQELTHRTFFRGTIRKRMLPLRLTFDENLTQNKDDHLISSFVSENYQFDDLDIYFEEMSGFPTDTSEASKPLTTENSNPFANNPFGSPKVVRKRKQAVGKLVKFESNHIFGMGIINLPEFTKPNRKFFIKVKLSQGDNLKIQKKFPNLVFNVEEDCLRLYIEGFVPRWFPDGWQEEPEE